MVDPAGNPDSGCSHSHHAAGIQVQELQEPPGTGAERVQGGV